MNQRIKVLDCTLRDGAYITESKFGAPAIKGIIKKMQDAGIEIIECGWLKDKPHAFGTTYFHVPDDLKNYVLEKKEGVVYSVMIDWDRYDLDTLPPCDHQSVDAIRVVFPHGKHEGGAEVARKIREKGYDIYLQAANTLAYNDEDLTALAECVNKLQPKGISIVDTFGAMYPEDLERIMKALNARLLPSIALGLHTHNNQQLAFAHTAQFVTWMMNNSERKIIVDSSLCGMGRGAGNATTELVTSFLNRKYNGSYDLNCVMDAIDTYMEGFKEKYEWGYSTPYFIAGLYCCHVNNIAYLIKNHRTSFQDMRNIVESMDPKDRRAYDYDLLENKYLENQNRIVEDEADVEKLKALIDKRPVLLVAPGKTIVSEKDKVDAYIKKEKPVIIAVNSVSDLYDADLAIFTNASRYDYAKTAYAPLFNKVGHIVLSNIETTGGANEYVINFNRVIKRGWEHFDNAVILTLRLLHKLSVKNVALAGFDGFKHEYNESYFDESLPTLNPGNKWDELNKEVLSMFEDLKTSVGQEMAITFVTSSIFNR